MNAVPCAFLHHRTFWCSPCCDTHNSHIARQSGNIRRSSCRGGGDWAAKQHGVRRQADSYPTGQERGGGQRRFPWQVFLAIIAIVCIVVSHEDVLAVGGLFDHRRPNTMIHHPIGSFLIKLESGFAVMSLFFFIMLFFVLSFRGFRIVGGTCPVGHVRSRGNMCTNTLFFTLYVSSRPLGLAFCTRCLGTLVWVGLPLIPMKVVLPAPRYWFKPSIACSCWRPLLM